MPPILQFLIRRIFSAFISLIIITMVLYSGFMLTPPEARARIYLPPGKGGERASEQYIENIIKENHLREPYLVQYFYWAKSLLQGSWGYSPTLNADVLPSLLHRTPATLELALYSLLMLIPLGLASGLVSGWRPGSVFDSGFRGLAFLGTSTPSFIVSIILISILYIQLDWLAPGRIDVKTELQMFRSGFVEYTGALTLDSLLNKRFDIFIIALKHLIMPVFTLSIYHWATLGRITRASIMNERGKEYIVAARARGVKESKLIWKHALRAILAPSLTAMALSAASIVTGLFVTEIIYGLTGISQIIVIAMSSYPDAPAALGFSVYSVIMVLGLMLILDFIQATLDPRVREEVLKA
ncbi:MAG TPA: ABC transporter permease [Anaerolineales bacterium]|nr:ABC transporter permease [Anaerolineales bacterium]HNA53216.1 ABC transporter permease [Anaerolineales bacterium]HNB85150.1 ABC transporter permease [Anaerolineales bacterium]HNC87461.1 ABC transporter permease [Anaerolineales bacterium]HND90595.1 ABC transporter permease [Anaerolineales bacterium]